MSLLSSATPPLEVENARQFELSDELRGLQKQMAALFSHQKRRGGIIDPEAEDSKLLLVTDTTVSDTFNALFVFVLRCEGGTW
jgi:E3 ubiquitin-protein ligase RNF25